MDPNVSYIQIIRKQVDDQFIQEEIKRIGEGKPSEFHLGYLIHYTSKRGHVYQMIRKLRQPYLRRLMKHLIQYIQEVLRCIWI